MFYYKKRFTKYYYKSHDVTFPLLNFKWTFKILIKKKFFNICNTHYYQKKIESFLI